MSEHNLVLLRGVLAAEATVRELPSGGTVSQFDVITRDELGTRTVPVAWMDPPPAGLPVAEGDELVVVGHVNRRFFRVGAATQSRTEVVVEHVVAGDDRRRIGRLLAALRGRLEPASSSSSSPSTRSSRAEARAG
ncbi:MAG: hypothetical protein ACR2HP_12590 [Ilumatobacteraceae bacterium]